MILRLIAVGCLVFGSVSSALAVFDEAQCQRLLAGFQGKLSRGLYNELRTQPGYRRITAYLRLSDKAAADLGATDGILEVKATKDELLALIEQIGDAHLQFASLQKTVKTQVTLAQNLAKPPLVIHVRKKKPLSASELKSWQPSAHVTALFERAPELQAMLKLPATETVHLEFGYGHDMSRPLKGPLVEPGDMAYDWWMGWLSEQLADPAQIPVYREAIPMLEAMHGKDLHQLVANGVEILMPLTHNILYGTFGVRGPLHVLAAALDAKPSIIPIPVNWQAVSLGQPVPIGSRGPAPEIYILRFDSTVNFDAAKGKMKKLGINILDHFVRDGKDTVMVLIEASEAAAEQARKLEGIEHFQKE